MPAASQVIAKLVTIMEDAAGSALDATTTAKLTTAAGVLEAMAEVLVPSLEAHNPTMEATLAAIVQLETDLDTVTQDIRAIIVAAKGTASAPSDSVHADVANPAV